MFNMFVLALLLNLTIVAIQAQEILTTKEPRWITIGHLKEARSNFHIRAISSHQVLVIGGYSRQSQETPLLPTTSVEIIDTYARTIHEESSMAEPHAEAALVQNGDSNLVIISGIGANNALTKTCEFYDRGYKLWHTIGSLIIARRNPMATFINNNEILVVGGTNEHGKPVIETEVFNINSGSKIVTHFPYSILEGRCSVSTGYFFGKAIVFAGKSNDNTIHREVYGYDRKNQKWEYQGVYIDSIFSPHLLRLFDDRLFISGGIQPTSRPDSRISNSTAIESYSGFKKTPSMILPRVNHSIVQWNNDSLLVIGGTSTDNTTLNQTEWFNMLEDKWISGPALKEARTNMQAISLPIFNSSGRQTQCRIIVVSGIGNENVLLSSVEILERLNKNIIVASNQEQNNIFRVLPFIQISPNVLISIIVFISCMTIALLYLVQSLRQQAKIEHQHFRTVHEKEHLQLQITTLQLQTLHLQMKPHFIYNSLAAVESLI
jgi:hypothetical protein